jgi:hypothetical protein
VWSVVRRLIPGLFELIVVILMPRPPSICYPAGPRDGVLRAHYGRGRVGLGLQLAMDPPQGKCAITQACRRGTA